MKRYLSSFTLPSKTDQEFALGKAVNRRTCYQNVYPFGVFGAWEETRLEMEPITILYGGNGSGKTTLLNLMGDALGLERRSVYNRAAFFQNFVDLCQWEGERQMPAGSAVLTSDDVFDDLLDLRSLNEGIDLDRQALLREYKDLRSQGFQLRSLDDYGHLKRSSPPSGTRAQPLCARSWGRAAGQIQWGDRPGIFHQPGDGRAALSAG